MEIFKKINYILTGRQKARMLILLVMVILGGLVELLGVAAIFPVVSVASSPDSIQQNQYLKFFYDLFHIKSANSFLVLLCIVLIFVYIFKNLYLLFMHHMQNVFMYNNQFRLSRELTDYYVKQPYLYFVNHNRTEIIRNVSSDSSMFFQALGAAIQLVTEAVICITLFIGLLVTDIAITVATAAILVFFLLTFLKITRKQIASLGAITREYARTMGTKLYQLFGGIKDIKVLEREEYFTNCYYRDYDNNMKYLKKYKFVTMLPSPVMESVMICGLLLVIIVRICNGADIQNLIPTLAVFAVAAFRMLPSLNRMTGHINALTYNKVAVDEVYKALKEAREKQKAQKASPDEKESNLEFLQEIKVENVTFAYPEREEKVLDRVSLRIPKNKSVAFVGPSGAGKTTLADVILNVLEPAEGTIWCDSRDIRECTAAWHTKIGYIPQAVFLIDDTIRNNVAFGIPEKDIDDERVWEVLREAQLAEFVKTLSKDIHTSIGECGSRLSGGQKQRIGIARALYSNPEILLMDEATSALDNDTESAVMEAVERLSGSKTLIIIAHRLSTIEHCDIVYEVRDGKVKCVRGGAEDENS